MMWIIMVLPCQPHSVCTNSMFIIMRYIDSIRAMGACFPLPLISETIPFAWNGDDVLGMVQIRFDLLAYAVNTVLHLGEHSVFGFPSPYLLHSLGVADDLSGSFCQTSQQA